MNQRKMETLAALGAFGAAGGIMLVWAALMWLIRPVSSGGMDGTSFYAAALAAGFPLVVLALVHAWLGVQLRRGPDSIRG
ncbi:MAG TPA: hypothetical protein VM764_07065 [Gemmatimonadaceae bacterium]|nr:hypothetical protein [Gemmatimonadaceae bacterium]